MTKAARSLVWVLALLVAVVVVAACASTAELQKGGSVSSFSASVPAYPASRAVLKEPTNGLVQSSTGGAVTIEVTWAGVKGNSLVFEVAMNTHSVNLDQYDLGKLAVLRDHESKEYRPTSWRSAPEGHHRQGTLAFPSPDSLAQGEAKYLELVIRDVAGIRERVLQWNLAGP